MNQGTAHPLLRLGAGVLLFGTGYVVYNRYQEGKRRLVWLDKHAPEIIDAVLPGQGKRIAEIGQARSRGRDSNVTTCSKGRNERGRVQPEPEEWKRRSRR